MPCVAVITATYGIYKGYRIQCCWSHFFREADHVADLNEYCRQVREIADALHRIYWNGMGVEGSQRSGAPYVMPSASAHQGSSTGTPTTRCWKNS